MRRRIPVWCSAVLLLAAACPGGAPVGSAQSPPARITYDPTTTYQTMTGWEATLYAGQELPEYPGFKDEVHRRIVEDVGINRARLGFRSGVETDTPYWRQYKEGTIPYAMWRAARYATVNDNDDPNVINWSGFNFEDLDADVENTLIPMRELVEARGEKLYVNLNYTAFTGQIGPGFSYVHDDPAEYAECILAVFLHLRTKYGVVPDMFELVLEPDNVAQWNGRLLGRALVETARRLNEAGFNPAFAGPSTTSMSTAVLYFDDMIQVPGALELLTEYSYHRYSGVTMASLQAIAERAVAHDLKTSQLEYMYASYHDLHEDLSIGRNSAWSRFTIMDYLTVDTSGATPVVRLLPVTHFLRLYFLNVRSGAVRVGATSTDSSISPLAFVNLDGRPVVVVRTDAGQTLEIAGLPAGKYGIGYATDLTEGVELSDVRVDTGGVLSVTIPYAGVAAIHARTLDAPPPPPPPPPPPGTLVLDPADPPIQLTLPPGVVDSARGHLEFSADASFAGPSIRLRVAKGMTTYRATPRRWRRVLLLGAEGATIHARLEGPEGARELPDMTVKPAAPPTVVSPAADALLAHDVAPEFVFSARGARRAWLEVSTGEAFTDVVARIPAHGNTVRVAPRTWRRIQDRLEAANSPGGGWFRVVDLDALGRTARSSARGFRVTAR